ncbi:MAG: hypothetical protein QOE05_254, partial [Actinomycetota bacterium]|nr:hypothetical protein [Actinomycetota bacterium]
PLLPNLVALRTKAVFVGGPQTYGTDPDGDVIAGCHATELTDTPTPLRCLRFDTNAANAGSGPLELHHHTNEAATTRRVMQRVFNADGTYRDVEAGTYELHVAHAHFHYNDFAVSSLWRSDAKGRRLDKVPVRQGQKAGFCLQDVYAFRSPAPAPRYTGPLSCYPTDVSPSAEISQVTGVSPGWVDVYDLSLPHQYIEVSGVPDGFYLLQIEIDPDHRLRETTTRDNSSWQLIRLCGDKVDLVGRTATCR